MYGAPFTRPCVIIPVYNHGETLDPVITAIREGIDIPIILIDDGSDAETKRCLQNAVSARQGLTLIGLTKNSGKGAAVMRGIDAARELGFTHALQIDADGQHDAGRIPFFLAEAAAHPEAVICGLPRFDRSAPASRLWGRKISNGWAKIVTLSKALPDVLCGFRVYPVEPFWALAHFRPINRRMGFDTEILVRLYWQNIPVRFYPLRVIYPENGRSHFRLVRDNLHIAWTFTRLFLGMIPRLPALLNRRRVRGGGAA